MLSPKPGEVSMFYRPPLPPQKIWWRFRTLSASQLDNIDSVSFPPTNNTDTEGGGERKGEQETHPYCRAHSVFLFFCPFFFREKREGDSKGRITWPVSCCNRGRVDNFTTEVAPPRFGGENKISHSNGTNFLPLSMGTSGEKSCLLLDFRHLATGD